MNVTATTEAAPPALTEKSIQDALWWHLHQKGHRWMAPCFTPAKWWEMDMMSVTKAGFVHEYEIKLSLQDFKADAKKTRGEFTTFNHETKVWDKKPGVSKHQQLALADPNGPARFFFVTPEDMVIGADVPEWAGLIHVYQSEHRYSDKLSKWSMGFKIIKEAPKLHGQKFGDADRMRLGEMFYWRFWDLRRTKSV